MAICPKCGKAYFERPALSRMDNRTEICPECGLKEALESIPGSRRERGLSPAEQRRKAVEASGNRWAMENFNATHN